jgi:hypothetical protein
MSRATFSAGARNVDAYLPDMACRLEMAKGVEAPLEREHPVDRRP